MRKKSTKANSLKVIQGGKAKAVSSPKALTHKDIKEFFAKFAEAILVDQERVNELAHEDFHPFYDDGMWQRNREDHIGAIVRLSMTVDKMPKHLLNRLTKMAIAYKPEVVKQPFLNIISDLATGARSPWLYETASMFFGELIKDVSRHDPGISRGGNPMEMILRWFDYDDPIQIAEDPECEYAYLLASHIEHESEKTRRALAGKSRLEFIKLRVAYEFGDYLSSQGY